MDERRMPDAAQPSAPVGLLFPGQGAQYVGMGKALYEQNAAGRAVLEEAERVMGGGFLRILFEGPEARLTGTDTSQPAIYAVSYAAFRAWRAAQPHVVIGVAAGLSLGEYTALTAAGCIGFADGLRLVQQRGQLMQAAGAQRPGAMASVLGLEAEKVAEICRGLDGAHVANYNCPGQLVISGETAAIARAGTACSAAGARKVIPLPVSGAFHSPLMAEAQRGLLPLLRALAWQAPQFSVLSNVSGVPHPGAAEIPAMLGRQVVESVRWEGNCRWMCAQGLNVFYELGPGKVLQGLMKRIDQTATVTPMELPAGPVNAAKE